MVSCHCPILAKPVETDEQDQVQRPRAPQGVGPEEFSEGEEQQRGIQALHDRADLYNLRVQDRLYRGRIEDCSSGECDAQDRLPDRQRPESQKTVAVAQGALAQSWIRRYPGQGAGPCRALNDQAFRADRESGRESGKDGLRTSPRGDAEKPGFGTRLSIHQTSRARLDMDRQRAALSIQPRTRPK